MKITKTYTHSYSQYKPKQVQFKGYFAAPIKELHCQAVNELEMFGMIEELSRKCGKYFNILLQFKNGILNLDELKRCSGFRSPSHSFCEVEWGQDNKLFLESDKLLILQGKNKARLAENLAANLNIEPKRTINTIEGGNCFLGKKPNGENFALVGKDALEKSSVESVAENLEVKPENLYAISQPDFHIDLAIRPLAYPYILVGDFNLMNDLVRNKEQKKALDKLNSKNRLKDKYYASSDSTIEELKAFGFVPIKVPGIAGKKLKFDGFDVNFINAIVHQNPDGSLIYITNKPNPDIHKKTGIDFEQIFQDYLKKKVPQIKEVHFIDGSGFISDSLLYGGGIHCLSSERPDFKKWKEILTLN